MKTLANILYWTGAIIRWLFTVAMICCLLYGLGWCFTHWWPWFLYCGVGGLIVLISIFWAYDRLTDWIRRTRDE